MPTLLITGANRGLGLEFVRQAVSEGWRVHACCRDPRQATALRSIGGDLHLHSLDVTDLQRTAELARLIDEPLDLLVANAGVYRDRQQGLDKTLGYLDPELWLDSFKVNTIAPVKLVESFLGHISKGAQKKIVAISSELGSIGENTEGGSYYYRSSKAALNMAFKNLAIELRSRFITVAVLHPGWVKTDMGGASAPLEIPDAVRGMRQVIADLHLETAGRFMSYDGEELPW
jgi:NAD(P)-dependent dehydrogenase (short-subunit alcohol dehydrogenase family)